MRTWKKYLANYVSQNNAAQNQGDDCENKMKVNKPGR